MKGMGRGEGNCTSRTVFHKAVQLLLRSKIGFSSFVPLVCSIPFSLHLNKTPTKTCVCVCLFVSRYNSFYTCFCYSRSQNEDEDDTQTHLVERGAVLIV